MRKQTVYVIVVRMTPSSEENRFALSPCIRNHPIIIGRIITAGSSVLAIILPRVKVNILISHVSGLINRIATQILQNAIPVFNDADISLNSAVVKTLRA